MLVGLVSDTHDRLTTLDMALARLRERGVAAIVHPGDYIAPFAAKRFAPSEIDLPVHCVFGNNDGEREGLRATLPQIVVGPLHLTLGGRKIVVEHFVDWLDEAAVASAEIVITGHTHLVAIEERSGRLYVNPGECCGWVTGRATVAVLDTESLGVEVIELKR